ncbi:MAG: glucosamine-6-phosphate deaminase, partial [Clostridia bacterium]|nr:glucosamine-6-phosphate deaminase [Clostridia bacterium]
MINYIETETYEKMSRMAANLISAQIILKPDSVLGLATGSSPIGIYDQLTKWYEKGDLDFAKVRSVNLDEYVGLDENHPQSYRYFMQKNLFDRVNIKRENTYVPNGVAENYDEECRNFDELIRKLGGIDIQLLGIGLDGHVGFNEPSDRFEKSTHIVTLQPSTIKANSRFFESENDVPKQAITLGLGAI